MLTKLKTKTQATAGALALCLALSPAAHAADNAVELAANADNKVEEAKQDQTTEKRKEILSEATAAIRETQNALKALDEKKEKDALAALERATGKLEIILARDPDLSLAPAGVDMVTYDVLADIDAVKKLRDQAEDALEDGYVQDARRLIRNLASEIVISVSNIPLATYPEAIKLAVKHIDAGEINDAKAVLQTALSTLVVTDTVLPLPVITAKSLLQQAATLAEKEDRSKEDNKHLTQLLDRTRTELEFAQALGYGSKKDFKDLYQLLDDIEDKTQDGKSGEGLISKMKELFKNAPDSSQ